MSMDADAKQMSIVSNSDKDKLRGQLNQVAAMLLQMNAKLSDLESYNKLLSDSLPSTQDNNQDEKAKHAEVMVPGPR